MLKKHCDWCGDDLAGREIQKVVPSDYMGRHYFPVLRPPPYANWPEVDICLYCLIDELRAQGKRPREER